MQASLQSGWLSMPHFREFVWKHTWVQLVDVDTFVCKSAICIWSVNKDMHPCFWKSETPWGGLMVLATPVHA